MILAPSTIEETILLTAGAFDMADKFQIPVLILTDQYFIDTYYNIGKLDADFKFNNYFIKTDKDYKRYEYAVNGISQRAYRITVKVWCLSIAMSTMNGAGSPKMKKLEI